jgi:WhiB family redox-sensing transcriptional regulator
MRAPQKPRFEATKGLSPIASKWEWQNEGLCKNQDTNNFFLEENLRGPQKAQKVLNAKKICAPCPVKQQCLEHALNVPEYYGVWGGLSEEERAVILKRRGVWKSGHINTREIERLVGYRRPKERV